MAVQYTKMKICLRVLKVDVSASNMKKIALPPDHTD